MKRRFVIPRVPRIRVKGISVTRRTKRAAIALLTLAVLAAAVVLAHDPVVRVLARTGNPLYDMTKAAWVWDATLIAPPAATPAPGTQSTSPPAKAASFLEQLVSLNINRLFLNAGWEEAVKAPYLAAKPAEYDQFIKAAHGKGIKVEALFGEPNFAKAANWSEFERHVNLVLDYNKQNANRFAALHLDIEPYGCSDYRGNEAAILRDYLAGLQKVKNLVTAHNQAAHDHLKVVLDVPVWWDTQQPKVDGQAVLPQLLKLVDEVVVMNYTADASKFISQGTRWLDAAKTTGTPVMMGMEFQPEMRGATLTALTDKEVQAFIQSAQAQFHGSKQFAGFAVHHFTPFAEYCQAQAKQNGATQH